MVDWEMLVPITLFIMIAAIVGMVAYFRTERAKAEIAAGGDYRKLAEEAVRNQRALLEEVERMNGTLKEIERLLREV